MSLKMNKNIKKYTLLNTQYLSHQLMRLTQEINYFIYIVNVIKQYIQPYCKFFTLIHIESLHRGSLFLELKNIISGFVEYSVTLKEILRVVTENLACWKFDVFNTSSLK